MIIRGIRNLLSNAHKYAPAGTTIYLRRTRTSPESLDIEVSDSGPGVARTDADRVFEPFTRGAVYTDNEGGPPGAGMGLAVVRLVAQMHRGDVTVTNHAQGGAIFTLTLRDAIGCLHRTGAPLPA